MARRGDPDALALLQAPDFPPVFSYLFEMYGEFLLWYANDRPPSWVDWHAWATLMQRAVTPWDLKALRQIHDARQRVILRGQS